MPCESSLEWLSVPYSLPWNAAWCGPLRPRNALHINCPLLCVGWQAASFIIKPQCGQCGLWAICYANRLSRRELSFRARTSKANHQFHTLPECRQLATRKGKHQCRLGRSLMVQNVPRGRCEGHATVSAWFEWIGRPYSSRQKLLESGNSGVSLATSCEN